MDTEEMGLVTLTGCAMGFVGGMSSAGGGLRWADGRRCGGLAGACAGACAPAPTPTIAL